MYQIKLESLDGRILTIINNNNYSKINKFNKINLIFPAILIRINTV